MAEFKMQETPLEGNKILEASAGTGKTYSVAILTLRLILEQKVPVDRILMVTFTNAAAAELEKRIRKFIREAHKYANGAEIEDKNIAGVVKDRNNPSTKALLQRAMQSLDNVSVMTINSFCQQTIEQFTFETNQSFDFEVVTEDDFILKNASQRFVREVLNVWDYEQFKLTWKQLKVDEMHNLLRKHLEGMEFVDEASNNEDFQRLLENAQEKYKTLKTQVENNFDRIKEISLNVDDNYKLGRESVRQSTMHFLNAFIKVCCEERKKMFIKKFNFLFYPYGEDYANAMIKPSSVYRHFFGFSADRIKQNKEEKAYISYNDQIRIVHKALNNESFKSGLRKKYDAVFIDEFQDTDRFQYEIFSEVFQGKTLFYIGDPKQSIFGWRNADLDTYKRARNAVGEKNTFRLSNNFRSTPKMLKALEKLMKAREGFNMFEDEEIQFETVKSGKSDIEELVVNEKKTTPITIWQFDKNDDETSQAAVAQEIFSLLKNGKIGTENVKPGDIGVLVTTKQEGRAIKKALARYNIPAVQRDDAKVLESNEAEMIRYLLIAAIKPKASSINRAIQSKMLGFPHHKIKSLKEEEHVNQFLELKDVLQKEGVYNMIALFLEKYGVREKCMDDVLGQRVLSNFKQIAEILHRLEKRAKLQPEDLVVWMERNQDDPSEEYQQRIESDEDAVQIATIHKAKGLQYPIVFAPSLCMIPKYFFLQRNKVNTFKKNGKYCFTFNYPDLDADDKKAHDLEKRQENRRLIYVTLTRAALKSYISYMPRSYKEKSQESVFDEIFNKVRGGEPGLIEVQDLSQGGVEQISEKYQSLQQERAAFTPRTPTLAPDSIKTTFGINSFSSLNRTHQTTPFKQVALDEAYDHFVFQELSRGAKTGDALHNLFEHMQFNEEESWEQGLEDAAKFYPNIFKEDHREHFRQLIRHCMYAGIELDGERFALSAIPDEHKIPELQFNFSINGVNKQRINDLLDEDAQLRGEADIQGLMTGYVDLLFKHNDKYYILDWKSNYLGNTLGAYNSEGLARAMKANNYELQYWIYTLAVKRWLESRLKDFNYDKHFGGVIYLFIRGIRQEQQTGIYVNKPAKERIDQVDDAFRQ